MNNKILKLFQMFGIKSIGILCSSAIIFFLQKKFGNQTQGFYGVLSNSILLLTILCQFGIPSLTSLELSANKNTNNSIQKIISVCFKALLVIQPIFIPIVFYQAFNIIDNYFFVILILLSVIFNIYIYFYGYILRGLNSYGWMIFLTETTRWIIILILILLFNKILIIESLIVYSIFISSLITCLIGYIRVHKLGFIAQKNFMNIKFYELKKTILNSSTFFLSSFGILCLQQMNIIQLSYYRSIEDAGIFNFTFKYLAFTIMPVSIISAKYAQIASEYFFKEETKKVKSIFLKSTIISFLLTASGILLLYCLSGYVYSYVNQEFDPKLFLLLGISFFIFSIYGFWVSFLVMVNKSKATSLILILAIIFNLIINYILTSQQGYIGTAISDLISNFVALIGCLYLLTKFWNFEDIKH